MSTSLTTMQRFWAKVYRLSGDGCWLWTGNTSGRYHYPHFWLNGRSVSAHRFLWQREHGPVPVGLELDHLCRVTRCVRPDHLEAVTHTENMRRSPYRAMRLVELRSANARRRAAARCKHGHEWTPENTHWTTVGRRHCRACGVIRQRGYRADGDSTDPTEPKSPRAT